MDDELLSVYPWIVRRARYFCNDADDAKDLASETVYKLLINRDKFDRSKPIKSWVLAIMHNTFVTMYRRSLSIERLDTDYVDYMCMFTPQEHLEYRELISLIRKMSVRYHSVDCLVYFVMGYSYSEISSMKGIPIGTVMSRIHMARKLISDVYVYKR